jgi:hypothetical protein
MGQPVRSLSVQQDSHRPRQVHFVKEHLSCTFTLEALYLPGGHRGLPGAESVRPAHQPGTLVDHVRDHIDMCRNIKPLFNFEPPATEDEVRAASLQFVRKISGASKPSRANEAAFNAAVDEIAGISARLLDSLHATAAPRNRQDEEAKARERAVRRFGR